MAGASTSASARLRRRRRWAHRLPKQLAIITTTGSVTTASARLISRTVLPSRGGAMARSKSSSSRVPKTSPDQARKATIEVIRAVTANRET
ncbi:Uncharacterised protein [Mycobacteroides abscessus subsp. abscessus]|nr:Uncharacterised protein [Mycobacteroides abscessus subsp. abscessus]